MNKKIFLRMTGLILCSCILAVGVSANDLESAENMLANQLNPPPVNQIIDDLIATKSQEEDKVVTKVYDNIQESLQYVNTLHDDVPAIEIAKELRRKIGQSEGIINGMSEGTVLQALDFKEVQTQTSFIKKDKDGNQTILTEQECKEEMQKDDINECIAFLSARKTPDYQWDETPDVNQNGYMKMMTTATRFNSVSPDGREVWIISGEATWLKISSPVSKTKNAVLYWLPLLLGLI